MLFDWDEGKEKANVGKHDGVDFDEASEAFFDENAFEFYDEEHSTAEEQRFVCIGNSSKRLLRVSYTVRADENGNEIVRVISARKGKKPEENLYYGRK